MARLTPDPTLYPTVRDAIKSPPEDVAYVAALYVGTGVEEPDFLAVVDVDPSSATYGKIVYKLPLPYIGDELHHFGWNACSSAYCPNARPFLERRYLIVPGLKSSRVYIVDTKPDKRRPSIHKIVEPKVAVEKTGYTKYHTVHCGPDAIYISALGGPDGRGGPGGVLLLDHNTFEPLGRWEVHRGPQFYAYDFWWNLPSGVMISSEWTTPECFENGFSPECLAAGKYGHKLHVWDLGRRRHLYSIDLGEEHRMVLEVRPLHDPTKLMGFVNVVVSTKDLSSSIWLWFPEDGRWHAEKVIEIEAQPSEGPLPPPLKDLKTVPPLVTDIDVSLDDRFLYVSLWGLGELRQYDITNPHQPRLAGRVKIGGILHREPHPSGAEATGAPQMISVSRDGRRVYITNSLYSSWDNQFYPGLRGWMAKINVNPEGGLELDKSFFVDFGRARAHQVRLWGGDASTDSFCFP
ncbi:MAG: selenium-binding protein SBP56-related protein [Pyrobaculum sp.]